MMELIGYLIAGISGGIWSYLGHKFDLSPGRFALGFIPLILALVAGMFVGKF